MTSNCSDKEAAWQFLRLFFLPDYQEYITVSSFPTNRNVYEEMKQEAMNEAVTTRRTLLDRLEAVNKRAYEELTAEGAAVSPAAFRAFMDSYNELKGNVVDDRWEHIARAERSAQTDDVFDVFNERAWFR